MIRILLAMLILGSQAVAQSNVVVIVVDQLSEWATNPATRAPLALPAIDQLAANGTTFTRCYATSPVCAANRLALLTGQYPFTLGTNKLQPGTPTLGTILTSVGWDTGYVGKWHLSPVASTSGYVDPADRPGWRYFAGNEGAPHRYLYGNSFKGSNPNPILTAPWAPTWDTGEAVRFIRASRSKPFALVVNYGPPHPAIGVGYGPPKTIYTASEITPRPNVPASEQDQARVDVADYMSLAVTTDDELGVLLAEIDLATTFVVLTSDHGDMLRSHQSGDEQKRRPYEEAVHVPLIIAGPGIAKGVTDAGLIGTVDILPSILSLLGVVIPPSVQGSVFPYLSPLYMGHDGGGKSWLGESWRGLVSGEVKYAVTEGGTMGLWDLTADPYEQNDLAQNPIYRPTLQAFRNNTMAQASAIGDPFFDG